MLLGKLLVPGRPTNMYYTRQGPSALALGAGGGCLQVFFLSSIISLFFLSLWETARYRLTYCLKGLFNSKQPTNHLYFQIFGILPSSGIELISAEISPIPEEGQRPKLKIQ